MLLPGELRKSGHWRQAMTAAAIVGYDAETLARIAEEMLGDLQSMRRFAEAAALCSTYMADPLRTAKLHMEASEWSAAVGQVWCGVRYDMTWHRLLVSGFFFVSFFFSSSSSSILMIDTSFTAQPIRVFLLLLSSSWLISLCARTRTHTCTRTPARYR